MDDKYKPVKKKPAKSFTVRERESRAVRPELWSDPRPRRTLGEIMGPLGGKKGKPDTL